MNTPMPPTTPAAAVTGLTATGYAAIGTAAAVALVCLAVAAWRIALAVKGRRT